MCGWNGMTPGLYVEPQETRSNPVGTCAQTIVCRLCVKTSLLCRLDNYKGLINILCRLNVLTCTLLNRMPLLEHLRLERPRCLLLQINNFTLLLLPARSHAQLILQPLTKLALPPPQRFSIPPETDNGGDCTKVVPEPIDT